MPTIDAVDAWSPGADTDRSAVEVEPDVEPRERQWSDEVMAPSTDRVDPRTEADAQCATGQRLDAALRSPLDGVRAARHVETHRDLSDYQGKRLQLRVTAIGGAARVYRLLHTDPTQEVDAPTECDMGLCAVRDSDLSATAIGRDAPW